MQVISTKELVKTNRGGELSAGINPPVILFQLLPTTFPTQCLVNATVLGEQGGGLMAHSEPSRLSGQDGWPATCQARCQRCC